MIKQHTNNRLYVFLMVAVVFTMACTPVVKILGSDWGWSSSEQGLKYIWFQVVPLEGQKAMKFTTDLMGRSTQDYRDRGSPEALWHSELRFYATHGHTAEGIDGKNSLQLAGKTVTFHVWIPPEMAKLGSNLVVQGMVKDTTFRNVLTTYETLAVSQNGYWKDFTLRLPDQASDAFDPNFAEAFVLRIETPMNSQLPLTRLPIYLAYITVS